MGISFLSSSMLSLKLSNLFMDNLRWMNIEHVVCYWIWMGIYINTRTSFEGQIICLILLIPLKKYTQCSYIWFQFHTRLYKSLRIFNELFQKSPPLSIEDSEFWILKIPGSRWKKSRKTPGGSESFDGIPGRGGVQLLKMDIFNTTISTRNISEKAQCEELKGCQIISAHQRYSQPKSSFQKSEKWWNRNLFGIWIWIKLNNFQQQSADTEV